MPLNIAHREALDVLLSRRSVKAREMVAPGPDGAALETILAAGMRVPDHGKLAPWRFLVFSGEARTALGEMIREAYLAEEAAPSKATAKALARYPEQAPLLVVLVSSPSNAKPIPEWEQRLSTGAAGMAMLIAAHAQGYVGQWLTGWPAYSAELHRRLGLAEADRIAGYLFFGSPADSPPEERERPDPARVVRRFTARRDL